MIRLSIRIGALLCALLAVLLLFSFFKSLLNMNDWVVEAPIWMRISCFGFYMGFIFLIYTIFPVPLWSKRSFFVITCAVLVGFLALTRNSAPMFTVIVAGLIAVYVAYDSMISHAKVYHADIWFR